MRAPPSEGVIQANGLPLHVLTWDGGGRTTLLLLHGYLDQAWSFSALARALPDDLHVVALDLRGHGDSGWIGPGGYYHFPDYVLDLVEVVDAVRRDRLVLVGHSMGGTIAALAAGTLPAALDALVMVEGLGTPDNAFEAAPPRFEAFLRTVREARRKVPRPIADLGEVARRLRKTCPRIREELLREIAAHAVRPHSPGEGWVWKYDPLHRTRSPTPFYFGQFAEFLRRITCPTLLCEGAESQMRFTADEAARRCSLVGSGVRVVIPGAGHMVHVEAPEALAAAISRFLEDPVIAEPSSK